MEFADGNRDQSDVIAGEGQRPRNAGSLQMLGKAQSVEDSPHSLILVHETHVGLLTFRMIINLHPLKSLKFILICYSDNRKLIYVARVTYLMHQETLKETVVTPGRIIGIMDSWENKMNGKSDDLFAEGNLPRHQPSMGTNVGILIKLKNDEDSIQSLYGK